MTANAFAAVSLDPLVQVCLDHNTRTPPSKSTVMMVTPVAKDPIALRNRRTDYPHSTCASAFIF